MCFHYFAPENQEKSPFQNIEKHDLKSQIPGARTKNSRFLIFVDFLLTRGLTLVCLEKASKKAPKRLKKHSERDLKKQSEQGRGKNVEKS